MKIYAYAASGYAGQLVSVEVDIRRGIPGLDIVGLPDNAVRESRERVRIAISRSGFEFPKQRILVNLSPADLKKEGAAYDLPIAVGILAASNQLPLISGNDILCIGELLLDGSIRSVSGVLPAVAAAKNHGVNRFIVPAMNLPEALTLACKTAFGIAALQELVPALEQPQNLLPETVLVQEEASSSCEDISELRGQPILKRGLEICAAGGHHLIVFGPPGSGKTMGIRTLPGLLPDLSPERALEVTRIWSQSGSLGERKGLIYRPPFREPHHTATSEGLVGGAAGKPGEVSLAHGGILFLDEAPEFGGRVLQSLREPLESGRIDLARAGRKWWYPADFQLVMAMNPCPCGNLGREEASCLCTAPEISRYWRRIGGALMDRVDIRVPVSPVDPQALLEPPGEDSRTVRERVNLARDMQLRRYHNCLWSINADIPPGELRKVVKLDDTSAIYFTEAVRKLGLSSRAAHGVLRVARSIADLSGRSDVDTDDILEAVQHRRLGDRDLYWTTL
ncbi:MAG: hypothetical protein B0D92_07975 [Spirochaeta sp. LUC14_002_19_P3]|nr:MAG: hypothetical protein B0D92_07975 [Spirochaeta sp. LUC14_002_19_P3]